MSTRNGPVSFLPGCPVGRVGVFRPGDLNLPLGNHWPGERRTHQAHTFIDRVGSSPPSNVIADELFAQVSDAELWALWPFVQTIHFR